MSETDYLPKDYDRVIVTGSEEQFLKTGFNGPVNLIVLPRPHITADFTALAHELVGIFKLEKKFRYLEEEDLKKISEQELRPDLQYAFNVVQRDVRFATENGYTDIQIRVAKCPEKSTRHVHSDTTHASKGRLMCCYNGLSTRFFRNEDIARHSFFPALKEQAQPFQLPLVSIWKHRGIDNEISMGKNSSDAIENAAYHAGVDWDDYSIKLVADPP